MESDGHGEEKGKVKERKGEGGEERRGVRFFSEIVKSVMRYHRSVDPRLTCVINCTL